MKTLRYNNNSENKYVIAVKSKTRADVRNTVYLIRLRKSYYQVFTGASRSQHTIQTCNQYYPEII